MRWRLSLVRLPPQLVRAFPNSLMESCSTSTGISLVPNLPKHQPQAKQIWSFQTSKEKISLPESFAAKVYIQENIQGFLCLIFPAVFWMMIDFPCWKGIVFFMCICGEVLEALLLARPGPVVRSVHAILDWPSSRGGLLEKWPRVPAQDDRSPRPSTPCWQASMIRLGHPEGNPS